MTFTKRRSLLLLIDAAVSFQILSFAVMIDFSRNDMWLDFKTIPFTVYVAINALLLIAVCCLYLGIFRLSNVFTLIGLLLLLFLLHALFAIVLIIYINGREETSATRKRTNFGAAFPEKTHRTVLFPGLWICVWSFVLARLVFFFITMQEFKKHPTFVRHSMHLIRAISSVGRERSVDI